MIEKCLGGERSRKVRRALRQFKVTFFCLLLTFVVLRGTIGAGKFGTPQQDLIKIRNRLYFPSKKRGADPHRVVAEDRRTTSSPDTSATTFDGYHNYNYNEFDVKTIMEDEAVDEKSDTSQAYSLGPKLSNWDQLRSKWLKENPNFPNYIGKAKPRVLLVTGSLPKACENPIGDHYLLKSIKNKIDYCRVHGIEIFYNMAFPDAKMTGFWPKLVLIRKLLLSHPEVELFWWMDSDAMFTDMAFDVPWERYNDHNLIMHGWKEMVYDQKNWMGLNTGAFLLRNCQWSLNILDAWGPMALKGTLKDEAGKLLTKELKDRPIFEGDDQSAMVYMLAAEREKWDDKVYVESEYYLGILVDRYEEMIRKYRASFGDHRWPLVTHFVGCKPCAKFADYPVERCLRQMDRAFSFGDNQILRIYGFTHKSLASRRVERVRNETQNPLEIKDELGLHHPTLKAVKKLPTTDRRI